MTIPSSIRDQVVALAKEGHAPREIRPLLNWRIGTFDIYTVLQRARKKDKTIPGFKGANFGRRINLEMAPEIINPLYLEALKRDLSTAQLIGDLLLAIVEDKLVAAILDDGSTA